MSSFCFLQGVEFCFDGVVDDVDVPDVGKVGAQQDFKFIGEAVAAVFYFCHLAEEDACGKDCREAACLYDVALLDVGMAWHIVHISPQRFAAFPLQITEILRTSQAAADAAVAVKDGHYECVVRRDFADDAYHACAADDTHLWFDSILAAHVDDKHVVALADAIVDDLGGDNTIV